MEEANGGGTGAAGGGGKLLGFTENVPVALLLPPESAGHRGQHDGRCGRRRHVQQHVPDSFHTAPRPAETSGPQGAYSRPRARRAAGSKPSF